MIDEYRLTRDERRADMLLDEDFEAFVTVDEKVDPLFGSPVSPEVLQQRFAARREGRMTGFLAFKSRTWKRWVRFCKKLKISETDKLFLSRSIRQSLGE